MKPIKLPIIPGLAFAAAISCSALAAEPAPPNADAILRAMSTKLAQSKQFTFEATRDMDAALADLEGAPEKARVAVAVSRPSQFAGRAESREGTRRFIADGRRLTVADEKAGFYAQVPMRATIVELVEALDAVYGFTPPLAEFALSDVHRDLRRQARSITYLGTAKVGGFLGMGGVECHRIGLAGRNADAELWVATGDQLPRKLVATLRTPGRPQLRVSFSSWNLAAPLSAADFRYAPPAGAAKVEMWTKSQMHAARKN